MRSTARWCSAGVSCGISGGLRPAAILSTAFFLTLALSSTAARGEPPTPPRDKGVAAALDVALDWLARHQDPARGCWDSDRFNDRCEGRACAGKGYPAYDPGLAGLVTLLFVRCGHSGKSGKYAKVVGSALDYLTGIQSEDGCYPAQMGHFMYQHAICTLAVAEAYAKNDSPALRDSLVRALAFIYAAQNDDPQGQGKLAWRYTPKSGDNDVSVTCWVVAALRSARRCGMKMPADVFPGVRRWVLQTTDKKTGRIGYQRQGEITKRAPGRLEKWPPTLSASCTAAGIACRIHLGDPFKSDRLIAKGLDHLMTKLPAWGEEVGGVDMYYWYHATQALSEVGGGRWRKWSAALRKALLEHQQERECCRGSWDPVGPWGEDGGRVYATAILGLCLAALN